MHRRTCPPFRRQGGGELCQPRDRAWRAMPRRAAFGNVVRCLVRTTHADVARAALPPSGRDGETNLGRAEKPPFTQAAVLAGIGRTPAEKPLQSPPDTSSVSGNNFLMRSVTLSIAEMTSPKGALIHSPMIPFSRKWSYTCCLVVRA